MKRLPSCLPSKIVELHVEEVGTYSYTVAEPDGPQAFKQASLCPEISAKFYKLSGCSGTIFPGRNEQHT